MQSAVTCAAAILLAGALAACGGEGREVTTPPVGDGIPRTLAVVSGNNQTGLAGDTLSQRVVVLVRDSAGAPVPNVDLRGDFADVFFLSQLATTDAKGNASLAFRLCTRTGPCRYAIHMVDRPGWPSLDQSVTATAMAGPPAKVTTTPSNIQNSNDYAGHVLTALPTFTVTDRFGNPTAGASVRFSATGGGSVVDSPATADSLGRVTPKQWTLGSAIDDQELKAAAGDAAAGVTVHVVSGPPAILRGPIGDSLQAPPGATITDRIDVIVTDAAGRRVSGADVTWTDHATGRALCSTKVVDGRAELFPGGPFPTCGWSLRNQPGTDTLDVSSGAARTIVTARAVARPQAIEVITDPTTNGSVPLGGSLADSVRVRVTLPDGAPAAGYRLVLTRTFGNGPSSVLTDSHGIASIAFTLPTVVGRYSLTIQVGAYPDISRTFSVSVVGSPPFTSISAGAAHTCAATRDASNSGSVWCWGRNASGELGDGSTARRVTPTLAIIPARPDYTTNAPVVTAGTAFSCAHFDAVWLESRRTSFYPGYFYCWGANTSGQAGVAPSPTALPVLVATSFGNASAGATHACGIHYTAAIADSIKCWGDNRFGQLGDGTTTNHATPLPTEIIFSAASVSAGDGFSCAMLSDGRAFCWGKNSDGRLGDFTNTDKAVPTQVGGTVRFDPSKPIALGDAHACALTTDGTAYCWGRNDGGQLGDGTSGSKNFAVAVNTNLKFVALTAGGSHTCALTSGGTAYCWGANDRGQLGVGSSGVSSLVPIRVATSFTFSAISAGSQHTCALAAGDQTGYCWGLNADGQLGDGTTIDRSVPTPVASVAAGANAKRR